MRPTLVLVCAAALLAPSVRAAPTPDEAVIQSLRRKAKAGALSEADRAQAQTLFWYRGPMLEKADRLFLLSLQAQAARPSRPSPQALQAPRSDPLYARLLSRVRFAAPDKAEGRVLSEGLRRLLRSPSARAWAADFLALDASARLSFAALAGGGPLKAAGVKAFRGLQARTSVSGGSVSVELNELWLQADRRWREPRLAQALAHELLGHGLERLRAQRAGLDSFYAICQEDEDAAALAGWTASAESGAPLWDPWMWTALRDPEQARRSLQDVSGDHAARLDAAQMQDPLAVLRGRLERGEAASRRDELSRAQLLGWAAALPAKASSGRLRAGLKDALADLPGREQRRRELLQSLRDTLAAYSDPRYAASVADLKAAGRQPFFQDLGSRLAERRAHLAPLAAGKSYGAGPDAAPWTELAALPQAGPGSQAQAPAPQALGRARFAAPAGWELERSDSAADPSVRLEKGLDVMRIRYLGGPGSRYRSPSGFLRGFEATTMGRPPKPVRRARLAGREVRVYGHGYPVDLGDPHLVDPRPPALAREEFCLLPSGRGFFVLSWAHESPVPDPEAAGEKAWRALLASFILDQP